MDTLIFCDVSMDVLGRNSISPSLCVCVCIRCSSDWRDCEYRERADDKVRWFLDEGERRRVLGAL